MPDEANSAKIDSLSERMDKAYQTLTLKLEAIEEKDRNEYHAALSSLKGDYEYRVARMEKKVSEVLAAPEESIEAL